MISRPIAAPGLIRGRWIRVLVCAVLVASGVLWTACDPGHGVTFENQTQATVNVFNGDDLDATLSPGTQRTLGFIEYMGLRTFVAKDESGTVVFQEQYSWDDLKRLNWRIVIRTPQG